YLGIDGGLAGLPVGMFELAVAIRALILVACVIGGVRGARAGPRPPGQDGGPAGVPGGEGGGPAGPHPSSRTPDGYNRAVPASTRTIGIGVVFLLVAGTLAVGLAFKLPCAVDDWTDGRAFTRGCYTDLVGLIQSEQLTGGRLPYLDPCEGVPEDSTCDEYPVLTMYTMRLAAWAS